jgi:uncharacterized protein (TIGR03083 family)
MAGPLSPNEPPAQRRQGATTTAHAALREAAARTAALLRTVPNTTAPAPGLAWNVAEIAAHLVGELKDCAGFVTGERNAREHLVAGADRQTPSQRTALANARQLEDFGERDVPRLADMLVPAADGFIAAAVQRPADARILTANGLSITVPMMTAALLGEQLIHGLDIARAARLPWHIARGDAILVTAGAMAMVPDYLDHQQAAELRLSYDLRFRGGTRYRLAIDHGRATIGDSGPKADCVISADPVAFLLVGYGRTGQWGQILRGKIVAGGRKPWLGLKFGRLITGP